MKGIENLNRKLRDMAARAGDPHVSVSVGYTAQYALWVHENRQMKWAGLPRKSGIGVYWGPKGRAGFLLDVAREMSDELAQTVRELIAKGKTVAQALLVAGLKLQRGSQKEVPVEHGNLRASAFTRLEKE